jgi:hypothetical protein
MELPIENAARKEESERKTSGVVDAQNARLKRMKMRFLMQLSQQ